MKLAILKIAAKIHMGTAYLLSVTPVVKKVGKPLYAACLFGAAMGLYFNKQYKSAIKAYEKALSYSKGMEVYPPINFCHEEAYKALGAMYEKGLGVEKDEIKAEEFYLRAGSRGDSAYEHSVATKSYNEKYK